MTLGSRFLAVVRLGGFDDWEPAASTMVFSWGDWK
jgi:hypothetical protein